MKIKNFIIDNAKHSPQKTHTDQVAAIIMKEINKNL